MATNPNPDFLQETMFQDFGTKVLITNPKADKYLNQKTKSEEIPSKYSQWCDGEGGESDCNEQG